MKLYNLYEEVILEGLITEGVDTQQVLNAINGEYANNGKKFIRRIKIHYDGDDVTDKFGNTTREGKGWRNIVVHALGDLKNGGREVIRAYQVYGDSLRNPNDPQGWKLFRTDRISHWEPTNLKYWEPLEVAGQPTNMNGDGSMSNVKAIVNFDPENSDRNDTISKDNTNIDPKADTYRYPNAEPEGSEPVVEPSNGEEETNTPTFNDEDGVGFKDEKVKDIFNTDSDYEEEEIEDENNDEIKDF